MLHFVLGRSGFGKSEYLRRMFADLARAGEDKLLFIVPDQITFEYETAFLDLLGPQLSQRVAVLGFSRLCDRVFEQTGHRFAAFADEGVRNMVMSMALEQVSDRLTVFARRSTSRDMCEVMLAAVKEYKKCAITSADLRAAAERTEDETLRGKLNDTALAYDAYNAVMAHSYMDPLDSLTKLSEILTDQPLFDGYTVALDAFYGFTAQEYAVVERLMKQCGEMYVALTDDDAQGDTTIFFAPRRTRMRLTQLAKRCGIAVAPYIRLDQPRRFASPVLAAVEENLYRADKHAFDGDAAGVELYRAAGIYDECDYVARRIRALTESGYRYRDIAVIARDTSRYAGVLDICLDKYGVSYFMDQPQNIDAVPIVRLVSAVFDIVTRGFDRDDVLTLLKTGLCSYSVEDIADFENYLFVWDINGRGFYDEFTSNPAGFADKFEEDDKDRLGRVEALRRDVIGKLRLFDRAVKDADGRTIAAALMKLLYGLECDKNISRLCDTLEAQGEDVLSAELVRMWNVLCTILDKTVAVLGNYPVSARRFAELLYINFSNTEVASIPRGLDEVDIAAADRGLLSENKAVFVIGALDGEFPRTPVEAGVFTDNERVLLRGLDLPLSDAVNELFNTELYYVYSALTAASERLYVSYPSATLRGEALSPSDMIGELTAALPELTAQDYITVPITERLYAKRAAFDYLMHRYRSASPDINALREYFAADEDYAPILRSIRYADRRPPRRITDAALSRALFGERMKLSATRIDVYHKCPFMYFCEYGLGAKERRRAAIDALEYGTLIHHIFEHFFIAHGRESYASLTETAVADEVSRLLDEYIKSHFGGTEGKTPRFLYLFYRIKSTAVKLVLHIVEELCQSDFTPVDFELGVGEDIPAYTIELEQGGSLVVTGSVDRVDSCVRDGARYIRVVDYKTGVKHYNLYDIVYGINLQMFLYLSAIRSGGTQRYGGEITPAGVLYMPSVSPTVAAEAGDDEDSIRRAVMKEYQMKGVVLDDEEIITAMEHDKKGVYIPVSFKNGSVSAGADSLASLEEMGAIFRRVDLLLSQMAQSLFDGDVGAVPLKGTYDGCQYCRYSAVCLRNDDDPCREGAKMSRDEVYSELMKEVSGDDA